MSLEKYKSDAKLWLGQAEDDLQAAQTLASSGSHAQACFLCQQAGEKALKAVWYFLGMEPWGHSISNLIADMHHEPVKQELSSLVEAAALLDKLYIPTRYPNGLPNMMPRDAYRAKDSSEGISAAREIIQIAKSICKL